MPKRSLYTLIWSPTDHTYELHADGVRQHPFVTDDTEAWGNWLDTCTCFSFQGQQGRLYLLKEERTRGSGYWYAYAYIGRRKTKRYLGPPRNVTLFRLEEAAFRLTAVGEETSGTEISASILIPDGSPSSAQTTLPLPDPLLLAKLSPPRLPTNLVARQRLLEQLDQVFAHRLLLLSAFAGSGKTTLLAAWAAHALASSHAVAWLALDDLNREATRFWVSLILALRSCRPDIGAAALEMLHSPQPPQFSTILMALLRELNEWGEEITLILDDYHLIEDPSLHEALVFWLRHAPGHVHLILASRVDPPFSLAHLRVRGQLLELRDADLRFRQAEASQFLTESMGLDLSEEEVLVLEQRTEGWIAGLQLAALALHQRADRSAFIQAFTGSQRYVFDYIQEEIFMHLDTPLQDFLLHTSVLTRLHADLCHAVLETLDPPACQQFLERIERANLFLVPLDEERGWYRFHDLFREAVLARLRATQPARLARLHQRAAHWYETQNRWYEAITHALAASDFSLALRLMEQTVEQFWLRGETQILSHWIMALPAAVIGKHARFVLTIALYVINAAMHMPQAQTLRSCRQAERLMARVEEATHLTGRWRFSEQPQENHAFPTSEADLLRRRLRLLRLWSKSSEAVGNNDLDELFSIAQAMQQEEQEEEMLWQMLPLAMAFVTHFSNQMTGGRLIAKLLEARQQADQAGDRFAILHVRLWLALCSLQAGQTRQSYQQSQEALELLERMGGYVLLKGYFLICQANALYQWNRLEEARSVLHKLIHDIATWQQLDVLLWAYEILGNLEISAGDMLAASQALHEAERVMLLGGLSRHQCVLQAIQARLWLAQGDLTEASIWAKQVVSQVEPWGFSGVMALPMLLRVWGAQNQWERAGETLSRLSGEIERSENIYSLLPLLASPFVALHQSGEGQQARSIARRLLALTAPEGNVRVYLNEGEPMRQALQVLLTSSQEDAAGLPSSLRSSISQVLAAFEQEQQQRRIRSEASSSEAAYNRSSVAPRVAPPGLLVEPLSMREQEVLQLLSVGASNQEIATRLVISLTTVKKHVSRVLMKLNVENRTQATVRARELSLLEAR